MAKLSPIVYDNVNAEHRPALEGELDSSMVAISSDACSLLQVNANDELEVKIETDFAIGTDDTVRLAQCGSTGSPLKADLLKVNVGATSTAVLSGTGATGASGIPASPLLVAVRVSADSGNQVTARTDGLYVAQTVIPPSSVVVGDTNSVHLSGNGLAATPLIGDLIVDPATNNLLSKSAAGVKAMVGVASSTSISVTGSGTTGSPVTAAAIISPTAGNGLSATANGLFATSGISTVAIGSSTTTIVSGNGTNGYPLTVAVKISTAGTNNLTIDGTGLNVTLHRAQSATFTLTGAGTTADPLGGNVRVSTRAGNAITTVVDGLYVDSAVIRGNPTMAAGINTVSLTASGNYTAVIVHCVFHYTHNNDGSQQQNRTGTVTVTRNGTAIGSATSSLLSSRAGSDGFWQLMEADGTVIRQINATITAGQVIAATVPVTGYVKSADISITLV